jgi:cytochrome P450
LSWLGEQFQKYGDICWASIYGTNVYGIRRACPAKKLYNKQKGQAIKRFVLLLGNGLMVNTGEFWIRRRCMIQPAFNPTALTALASVISRS